MAISNNTGIMLGRRLISLLAPHCERLEIAGSVRRNKPEVKDVEIVGLGNPALLVHLDNLLRSGEIKKAVYSDGRNRWGEKYRGIVFPDMPDTKLELFLADVNNWGVAYWLRTGPADANEWLARKLTYESPFLMSGGYLWKEAGTQLTDSSRKLMVREEDWFFDYLDMQFVKPDHRCEAAYRQQIHRAGHQWGDGYAVPVRLNTEELVPAEKPIQQSFI